MGYKSYHENLDEEQTERESKMNMKPYTDEEAEGHEEGLDVVRSGTFASELSIPYIAQEEMPKSDSWFVWVQGPRSPVPQIWMSGDKDISGKDIPHIWKINLPMGKELNLESLVKEYSLDMLMREGVFDELRKANDAEAPKAISKVTLIDYTGAGSSYKDYAVDLLLFTKDTRLTMNPDGLQAKTMLDHDIKMKELAYMANTIPSSWEFVDYTFSINGVTRGFTHQLVRTRTASFAQQTMRVLDVSEGPGWGHGIGPTVRSNKEALTIYEGTMISIAKAYKAMIASGAAVEDARGVLPTNILTNIIMKCNMRTFVELVRKRSSPRVQGEYREVLEQMKAAVRAVHPWIDLFIERDFEKAAKDLTELIETQVHSKETRMMFHKLVDQMRSQS